MAYTTDQLEALERAIARGVLTVRHADGTSMTFQSLSEMRKLRREMIDDIAAASGKRRRRTFRAYQKGTGL